MAKQKVIDSASSSTAKRVGLRYIGNGAFLPGLPARDLGVVDMVEYATMITEMEAASTLGALYEEVASTSSAAASSVTELVEVSVTELVEVSVTELVEVTEEGTING